jgi:5,10-methylenetetrahydromethanopterin reductase
MRISCVLAPTLRSPEHIVVAERLGYERAWLFDTPQQSPDVWMTLGRAAELTDTIGIGPGVLVPSLRHPMSAAAATATLAARAPGRVAVAFGTGFTGRSSMGQKGLTWSAVAAYVRAYRSLVRGETVIWEGSPMKMFNSPDHLDRAAADVPILISALGPKGEQVTKDLEVDGIMAFGQVPASMKDFDWGALFIGGTVLEGNESIDADRVKEAAGPAWSVAYHISMDFMGGLDAVRTMPGGEAWAAQIEKTPESERHFAVHDGHLMYLNEADEAAWDAGGHAILKDVTLTGTPEEIRQRVAAYAEQGVTELGFQPYGAHIERELEKFMEAVG